MENIIEDYERKPVQTKALKNWFHIMSVIIVGFIAIPIFLLGFLLAKELEFSQVIIAISISTIILLGIFIPTAIIGTQTRLTTYMLSHFTFGKYGAKIISAVFALVLFGWFGINAEVFGITLKGFLEVFGIQSSLVLLIGIGSIMMISSAIFGFKGINTLSIISAPLLLMISIFALFKAFANSREIILNPAMNLSIGTTISMIIGGIIVGAVVMPDVSRYAKNTKNSIIGTTLGVLMGIVIMTIIAFLLAQKTALYDFNSIMSYLNLAIPGAIIIILASWTTNDSNLYLSSLSLSVIFEKIKKWKLTLITGLIGMVLAMAGISSLFTNYLLILGIAIPPIAGIYIVDYFIKRKYYNYNNLKNIKQLRIDSIFTWIISSFVGFATLSETQNGLGLITLTSISALDSIITAAVLHLIISYTLTKKIK